MANDIQMGEPKADVLSPDMTPDAAVSKPEEAAAGQEAATPMAVETATAAGEAPEATTEAKPEAAVEATPETAVGAKTETAVEATPKVTKEASPEATTPSATSAATATATTEPTAGATTTETATETTTAAPTDGAEGGHAPTGGDDTVVDEVIDAPDEFGGSRVVEREGSENGNYDEPSNRRGRRGRSRSRSRDRVGVGANGDNSRDSGRRRDNDDRERDRDHDRARLRDRDVGNSREHRDRGRDDSRDRNRGGNAGRDRDRGRENSRERDRGRGNSRDRDWSRDERDWGRGRDRDSFDNTRDRGRQSGGHGQGRRDRGPVAPMDGGRAGGREPFRGRGPQGAGPMMQPMGGGAMPMMQPMGVQGAPMFPPQASAHGQMVFSSNQRPQPMKMAGQTRMYNILPMISFKAFMAEQREDVTPEECKQRYDEYKADYTQRLTHSFIDVHRKEEWLLERYHPKMVEQRKEDKMKWVAQESTSFAEQLRANPVAFIASAALEPISEQQRWGGVDKRKKRPRNSSRDEASMDGMEDDSDQPAEAEAKDGSGEYDVDAKEFTAHSDKVLFIRRVPAWISSEELGRQIAVEAPKHERILCSDAANTRNEDFARSAFIIYDSPEKAARSVQKLNKMRIYQNQKPKAKVSKKVSSGDSKYFELKTFSYKPRSHTAADHDFSEAKRIVHDTKQSLKVAEALDEEFGRTHMPESIAVLLREPEVQEALSSSPAGTAQLDLVCAYMKRVYFYLYYRGQQCRDEGDMIASRSACRGSEAASKEDVQEAMRLADAEPLASMDGDDTPSKSGDGSGADATGNGAAAAARGKKREFGTEYVDECSAARVKDAGNAEKRRKKDAALLQRYEARVKEDVEAWQALHTGRTDEGYARCGMPKCAKLFKAAEFVHKHLINKHPEKHKVVVDQATDPFVRELFFADDLKPLPNIVADANTPPVVLLPGAMAMGGAVAAMPPGPPPMGAPGFPMMGGGMPMGPMGPMGPPGQMGGMGDFPMQQMQMPPDVMMGSGGRGFGGGRGRGGGAGPPFRGGRGGGGGGRFGGRGMGRMDNRPIEPIGPRDPRSLVSYIDVDAPKETTPNLDYGDAFPSRPKKKRKTM